ncbi:MAG TPA: isoamylase [Spirochaetota bacterium]|nr:isoamylase [Spirochaetota bacterium]HPP04947.1 isoamylase [Spirochaetota bacterium]
MKKIIFFLIVLFFIFSCSNMALLDTSKNEVKNNENSVEIVHKVYSTAIGENHPSSGAYSPVDQASWGSATYSLGAYFVSGAGSDATFAVYAKNATKVLLEIYSVKTGQNALYDYWMTKGSDNVWRAKLKTLPNGTLYAFRVWGPNWPYSTSWTRGNSNAGFITDVDPNGNRYNPNKVLYDPYAREISHDKETPEMIAAGENGGMYGTGGLSDLTPHGYKGPCTGNVEIDRRNVDTGKWAPKSVLIYDNTSFGTKPNIAQKDAIIYEAHVRGLTKDASTASLTSILSGFDGFSGIANIPAEYRGTYKGAAYMAKYLKGLGINTIELLPVHETANDNNPDSKSGGNYWGYMTYGYFAPDRRYAYDKSYGGPTKEFKQMVAAFHAEGIEVYLDVVYNHTGEGGIWDPKYIPWPTPNPNYTTKCREITCFAGFDNREYYALAGANDEYWESTGCGNNFDCSKTVVKNLVLDSLKYWADVMGVDGFRFDLAPVLGRDAAPNYNFNGNAQLLNDIASLGSSKNVEMIAEAWDCNTYQVGNFPSGWGEWNGRYRDQIRRFIKGNGNTTGSNYDPKFVQVVNGDYGYFNDQGGPHKTVNFIVAHDGFTLMDLVSYNNKNNSVSWPFGPSDGGNDDNDSWDCGGDKALRRKQLKNFWTIQFFSRGVPMIVAGDEFARTQNGNNNAYNVDSIGTWSNYTMINTDSPNTKITGQHDNFGTDTNLDSKNTLFKFAQYVINLRKNHPVLRQSNYNVAYDFRKENGTSYLSDGDKCVWIKINGSTVGDSNFIIFVNSYTSLVNFTLPAAASGKTWARIIDTASWAEANDNFWTVTNAWKTSGNIQYGVEPRSIVVFEEVTNNPTTTTTTISGWVRTVVFMYKETVTGQDIFIKGGHDAGLVPSVYPSMSEPIIYNNTKNPTTFPIKSNDAALDWGTESALDWTTNSWPPEWGAKKTYANDGYGEDPENQWGHHWWKFDVMMTGAKGDWFEFKAFMRQGTSEWWESDRSQSGTPYSTINHWGRKGYRTRVIYNDNWVELTALP